MGRKNLFIGLSVALLALLGVWLIALRKLPTQPDVITLKSGAFVRGEIVQQEFGKYVVVLREDSTKQVVTWEQIQDIQLLNVVPWYLRVNEALDRVVQVGVLGGFVIFGVGLWQYGQSQKWKRAEFLLSEIRLFEPKPNIVNIRRILDNSEANVYLYGEKDAEGKVETPVLVNRQMLSGALEGKTKQGKHTTDEMAIRIALNSYLSHLDHFNNIIDSGLVRQKELKLYLHHYLDILGNKQNTKLSPDLRCKLWDYMEEEGFTGATMLLKKFGYSLSNGKP